MDTSSYAEITEQNESEEMDKDFLIYSDADQIRSLGLVLNKDKLLGAMWSFLERNIERNDLHIFMDKFINVDPRIMNNKTGLLICQNYQAFLILCNRGFVPDKKFIDGYVLEVESCGGETPEEVYNDFLNRYGNVTKYLSEKGYINWDKFIRHALFDEI